MPLTTVCRTCHTLAKTRPYGPSGLLWLCADCLARRPSVATPCAPFTHQFAGSAMSGTWVCLRCGQGLAPVSLTTQEPTV